LGPALGWGSVHLCVNPSLRLYLPCLRPFCLSMAKQLPRLTETQIQAEVRAAMRRRPSDEPRAKQAHYDRKTRMLAITLASGVAVQLPIRLLPALRRVSDDNRLKLTVSPGGTGIRWDAIDADYELSGLLAAAIWPKPRAAMRVMGQTGGRATSDAKVRAARENGAKGGRPRKAARV
jgi:hypothetical protein